jgi:LRR receptor-like serine/threonine-protein kinase FLS2
MVSHRGLGLSANMISSTIPAGISRLNMLVYLYLDSNQLSGSVPSEVSALTKLR